MMKYCPECYKELPPDSTSCPFCGFKTGNGNSEDQEAPKIIKAPQTDSYIPPEQTVLSLLLLLIFFWGINLAFTTLPLFLNFGTVKNLIIAAIISQVLSRAMIGFWCQLAHVNVPSNFGKNVPPNFSNNVPPVFTHNVPPSKI